MKKTTKTLGCVLLATVACGVFSILLLVALYSRTTQRLVDSWRNVFPGQSISDVTAHLGQPAYRLEAGQDWGGVKTYYERFPSSYKENHGVFVYYVGGWGPHLLFIFFDEEGKVSFVWSSST